MSSAESLPGPLSVTEARDALERHIRSERIKRIKQLVGIVCVIGLIALAAYWVDKSDKRDKVEAARKVLRAPPSITYPQDQFDWDKHDQALEVIEKSGSLGREAMPELLLLLATNRNRAKVTEILRKLGRDAEEAIPALMMSLNQSAPDKTIEALDAIDPKWRDRPEVSSAVERFLTQATKTDHNGHLMGTSEERMEGAVALHRLFGDDPDRAHCILAPASFNERHSLKPDVGMATDHVQRIDKLIALLVENLEGTSRKTALFLLSALDANWRSLPAAKKAFPALVARLLSKYDAGNDVALAEACKRVAALVPVEVAIPVCVIWDYKERHGANGTRIRLLNLYGPDARAKAVSVILGIDYWLRFDVPSLRVSWVEARVRELTQLDPNWTKHSKAVSLIPELICLAVSRYPNERKVALETLAQIDPNWAKHPHAKLAVPVLARYLSPPNLESVQQSQEEQARQIIHAAEMLNRLGPAARDALPTLILGRVVGLYPNDSFARGVRPNIRETLDPLLAKLPDSVHPDWMNTPEALLAIPELIKLLETKPPSAADVKKRLIDQIRVDQLKKRPVAAAEMLGRFGPVARSALPALRAARLRVEKSLDDVKVIDEAIRRIQAP